MRFRTIALTLAAAVAVVAGLSQTPQAGGQGAPAGPAGQATPSGRAGGGQSGALRGRPGSDRQPQLPVPNIREYRPKSTLVVPEHLVPRAKFPVIDIHSHQPTPIGAQQFDELVASMDPLNLKVLVNASGVSGDRLVQAIAAIKASRHRDRMVQFTTVTFRDVGPGFGQRAAQQLEADVKAGALGVGELMKNFGLGVRKTDGSRLKLDDPELDPIWQTAARLNVPVFIHTADPQEFFQEISLTNERWLELALYPDRRFPSPPNPSFNDLMTERDRLFARNPKTTFVAAHLGPTCTPRWAPCCTTSAASPAARTTSS
jgi:predicted TIM-barrel fold metal-dependent hydrolase